MSFTSHASLEIWGLFDQLPREIQERAIKQYELFAHNPAHPSLHLKQIGPFWSARISRSYRSLAMRRGNQFYWFWIGSHDDYVRLLERL